MDTKERSISWDPDPAGLSIFRGNSNNKVWIEPGGGYLECQVISEASAPSSDLSPFLVMSAEKISITSSLSFYSLASFPASPSLLIVPGSNTHTLTENLRHPPTPPSFLHQPSSNETFIFQSIILERVFVWSTELVPGTIQPQPQAPFLKNTKYTLYIL